jgi:hypothetical protein
MEKGTRRSDIFHDAIAQVSGEKGAKGIGSAGVIGVLRLRCAPLRMTVFFVQ